MPEPRRPLVRRGAYDPPASTRGRPSVILWFRTYAAVVTLASGALAARAMLEAGSTALFAVGLAVAVVHGIGVAIPLKPWGWTYALALLAFGLFSCLLPFSIALLLYWKEPTTKAAFRRF